MTRATRIQPIAKDIDFLLAEIAPDAQKAQLVSFAREQLAEAQKTNAQIIGRVPPHVTTVDGRRGAALESVEAAGVINFAFEVFGDLLVYVWRVLAENAPVLTGDFVRSFVLLADGVEIDNPAEPPQANEYVFSNVQPYARKIERGLSAQAPAGVFEASATMARQRYGNVAQIRFGFRSISGGALSAWAARTGLQSHAPSRNRPGARRQDWLMRQPAIIVTPR